MTVVNELIQSYEISHWKQTCMGMYQNLTVPNSLAEISSNLMESFPLHSVLTLNGEFRNRCMTVSNFPEQEVEAEFRAVTRRNHKQQSMSQYLALLTSQDHQPSASWTTYPKQHLGRTRKQNIHGSPRATGLKYNTVKLEQVASQGCYEG